MSYLDNLKGHFLEWTAGKWAELESLIREKDELIRLYELELSPARVKEIRIRVRLSVLTWASQQLQQGSSSSSSGPSSSRQGQGSSSTSKSTPRSRSSPGSDKKRKPRKQSGLSSSTGVTVGSPVPAPATTSEGHGGQIPGGGAEEVEVNPAKLQPRPLSPSSAAAVLRQKLRDKFKAYRKAQVEPVPAKTSSEGHEGAEAGDPAKLEPRPLSPTSAAAILRQKLREKFNAYRKAQALAKPLKTVPLRFPPAERTSPRKPKVSRRSKLRDLHKKKKGTNDKPTDDLEVIDIDLSEPIVLPSMVTATSTSPPPGSSRSGSAATTPNKSKEIEVDVDDPPDEEEDISVLEEVVKEGRTNQNYNDVDVAPALPWNVDGAISGVVLSRRKNSRRKKLHGRVPETRLQNPSGVWLIYYNCACGYRTVKKDFMERHLRVNC